ncbi:MAG: NADH-quinone oxidoreductase subunit L [Actinomycetota bacterium]|nr:NADH-quinone oxidoreductase subunit L [Actinomycetota bacterium]
MNAAYVILGLPLLGAVILLVGGRRFGDPLAGWLATLLAFGSFAATIVTWLSLLSRTGSHRTVIKEIFTWLPVAGLHVDFALQIDPLAITMALFVTGVSSLIHLYSIGYMRHDDQYPKFFLLLNLFLFSMLVLVLANNFLFSFLGWEGVGFCSYALVGFWFDRNSAAVAAKKAFITNRVGDFGFMIALFLMFNHFGSFDYSKVLGPLMSGGAGALAGATATGIGLMLFLGAAGKSAQLPLYMWLPDAMEGPTPVSALIHAATMVTAGVYLMARAAPILHYTHSTQVVIAIVGAATAFYAATVACTQNDIKRVLAYSTISQLGYMFLAIGAGGYVDGLFHMISHAFFKALLFLAAGSVIHAMADEQDMKRMGALRKYLPITFPAFIVGFLALSGIFPFAGFWSKDDTLDAAWHMNFFLWLTGAVTAVLTAYYMSRQVALVFGGRARWEDATDIVASTGTEERAATGGAVEPAAAEPGAAKGAGSEPHGHGNRPHESPLVMTVPLVLLMVASFFGGLLNLPFFGMDYLTKFLAPVFPTAIAADIHVASSTKVILSIIVLIGCVGGIVVGLGIWKTAEHPQLEPAFLRRQWFLDDGLAAAVSGPLNDAAVGLAYGVDAEVVDGGINGLAHLTTAAGRQLRRLQTGYVRNYALAFGVGIAAVLCYVGTRVGN